MRGRRRRRLSTMIAGGWFALRRRLLCEISYEFVDGFWVFCSKQKNSAKPAEIGFNLRGLT